MERHAFVQKSLIAQNQTMNVQMNLLQGSKIRLLAVLQSTVASFILTLSAKKVLSGYGELQSVQIGESSSMSIITSPFKLYDRVATQMFLLITCTGVLQKLIRVEGNLNGAKLEAD